MANVDCRIARALQSYTITYPAPDETLLGTPVALPTSEPADPQISYTIAAGHLPTVSPAGLQYVLTAVMYAGGRNPTSGALTIYYRVLKNGDAVATGSASVAASNYYTWNYHQFPNVTIGDVLACKLWASGDGATWKYKALVTMPTRIFPPGVLLADVSVTNASLVTLVLGTPEASAVSQPHVYQGDDTFSRFMNASNPFTFPSLYSGPMYRGYRVYDGDVVLTSTCFTHVTNMPRYKYNRRLTAVSFRPLTIRV